MNIALTLFFLSICFKTILNYCNVNYCASCSSSTTYTCNQCKDGYYLFSLTYNDYCISCAYPCKNCVNSSSTCISCVSGYTYQSPNTCNPDDNNSSNSGCYVNYCEKCWGTSAYSCYECQAGYYNYKYQCYRCEDRCSTCNYSSSNCTSCKSYYYLYGNTCYLNSEYYTSSCNDSHCLNCTIEDSYKCLNCEFGYALTYYQQCEYTYQLYYNCSEFCYYCELNGTCIQCQPNYTLLNGSCYNYANGSCYVDYCLECEENNSFSCQRCQNQYFVYNYSIYSNNMCQSCASECFTCSKTSFNCTSCQDYYRMVEGRCIYDDIDEDSSSSQFSMIIILSIVLPIAFVIILSIIMRVCKKGKMINSTSKLQQNNYQPNQQIPQESQPPQSIQANYADQPYQQQAFIQPIQPVLDPYQQQVFIQPIQPVLDQPYQQQPFIYNQQPIPIHYPDQYNPNQNFVDQQNVDGYQNFQYPDFEKFTNQNSNFNMYQNQVPMPPPQQDYQMS